jgi:integrase/recombinase XerD
MKASNITGTLAKYQDHLQRTKSHHTCDTYVRAVMLYLGWLGSQGIKLANADRNNLNTYATYLASRYSASSVNTMMCAVGHFVKWLHDQGYQVPPMSHPELPRVGTEQQDFLSPEEVTGMVRMLNAWPEPKRTTLLVLMGSGFRVSELCELRLSDVKVSGNRVILCTVGKGNKYREAPLLEFARPYLAQYLRQHPGGSIQWLFPSIKNPRKPVAVRTVESWTRALGEQFGRHVFPHMLRHSYITALHEAGVDPLTLSKIAGHSNIATTGIYTHLTGTALDRAARRADNHLNNEEDDRQ